MTRRITSSGPGFVRRRLQNHRLLPATLERPRDVVAWLGAVQAQDYAGAKWALGLRARALTDATVDEAVNSGDILRTHVLRPTWHFVTPADIRWMLGLSAPRIKTAMAFGDRYVGLDARTFGRAHRVFERVLRGGRYLTRPELGSALGRAGIQAEAQRLAHILVRAEIDGVLCSGPRAGKHASYMLLDERVAPTGSLDRDQALAELARRYFRSHGPASVADYAWWSGLTVRDARRGIAVLGPALEQTEIEDIPHWAAAGYAPVKRRRIPGYLLPNYDEYLVAYRDRRAVGAQSPGFGRTDFFNHTVLLDGRVAGTWTRTLRATGVIVEVIPSQPWERRYAELVEQAARRFAMFLGQPVTVTRR